MLGRTGCSDTRLKEETSELETLTTAAFNILIDAHMHAKASTAKPATSCGPTANKQKNTGRGEQNNSGGERNQVSDTEKKCRQIMKGKCFRCASSDHFTNNCSLAIDNKCNKCSVQGHIAAACKSGGNSGSPAKANATGLGEAKDSLLQLKNQLAENENKYAEARAMGAEYYYPPQSIPFSGRSQYSSNNAESCAVTRNTDCNRSTPSMRL